MNTEQKGNPVTDQPNDPIPETEQTTPDPNSPGAPPPLPDNTDDDQPSLSDPEE
jgi:hypothetical protein